MTENKPADIDRAIVSAIKDSFENMLFMDVIAVDIKDNSIVNFDEDQEDELSWEEWEEEETGFGDDETRTESFADLKNDVSFLEEAVDEKIQTIISQGIKDPMEVRILINHPFPGEFVMTVPEQLATRMAQILFMLDEDEEVDQKLKNDVLFELLNVSAGNALKKYIPETETFSIGLPEKTESLFINDSICEHINTFIVDDEYLLKFNCYCNF